MRSLTGDANRGRTRQLVGSASLRTALYAASTSGFMGPPAAGTSDTVSRSLRRASRPAVCGGGVA